MNRKTTFFTLLLLFFLRFRSLSCSIVAATASNFSIVGTVYCDTCSWRSFSNHSYFLKGVDVNVVCRSRWRSRTKYGAHAILFSANATTDKYGAYKIILPASDKFTCQRKRAKRLLCRASLLRSSSSTCTRLGRSSSTEHVMIRSKKADHCVYGLKALSYRPPRKDSTICGGEGEWPPKALNTSDFFFPFLPPFAFPFPTWPPWPSLPLPPFPSFPPLPPLPFLPPLPPLTPFPFFPPFPFPFRPSPPAMNSPPTLPFPFPPFPPIFPPAAPVSNPSPPQLPSWPPWFALPPPFPAAPPQNPWLPFLPPFPPAPPQNQSP